MGAVLLTEQALGWEDKPSRVSQQQVEKEKKQNKMESVPLEFWKSGLWPDMRGLGEKSEMNHKPNIKKL